MAQMLSPGVQTKEFEVAGYIPGVSMSIAAIGGVFSWGPAEERRLVTDENLLRMQFGKPTDDNYETFMITTNTLAYTSSVYVSRAVDENTFNATNSQSNTQIQVKNLNDFTAQRNTLPADLNLMAKYPSALGNSLKVSICASKEAFSEVIEVDPDFTLEMVVAPGSNRGTITVTPVTPGEDAEAELNRIMDRVAAGDLFRIEVDNKAWNLQYLSHITSGDQDEAIAEITFANNYSYIKPATLTSIKREWEFAGLFNGAPGTTHYTATRGGSGDEVFAVVVDTDGVFTDIPNQVLEVYQGYSRATDARGEDGTVGYWVDAINNSSQYLWFVNDFADIPSVTGATSTPIDKEIVTIQLKNGSHSASESAIDLASLANAYDQFAIKDDVDISLLIAGKAVGGLHGEGLANYIIDNIASVRKDCIVLVSPQMEDVVGAPYREVENILEFRRALRYTDRLFLTSSYKYQYDRYNNKYRWVAGCGDDAGLMARTDYDRDPWWSPAGENRGKYKNIIRLAFNPTKPQRDELYKEDVNPVISKIGAGVMLYGDKTGIGRASPFDRINVRRLFDMMEKSIEKYANNLLFEFNDAYTQARFRNTVEPYLRNIMGSRGIKRYKVVCDHTNNTDYIVESNQFVGSIYVVPAKSINFITLNFVAVGNTVDFSYAIGEVDGAESQQ